MTQEPIPLPRPATVARTWRVAFVLRGAGLVLLAGALVTGRPGWAWPAAGVLLLVWATAYGKRRLLARGFGDLPCLRRGGTRAPSPDPWPKVTLIAPGRNEEEGIEVAARSWAAIDYPDLEVLAVDDHSTDRTGSLLDALAQDLPRLRVIHDPPLQAGWLGKANAVWHAVHRGDPKARWLLLTDADVVFHPEALRPAVALAESRGLDFLTCIPRLDNGSLAEELALSIQWQSLIAGARRSPRAESRSLPVGIGAFILVKRHAYLASGGHSVIHDRQPEDALLAAVVRQWGGKLGVAWTPDLLHVRLYRGWRQLVDYWARKNRVSGADQPAYFLAGMVFWVMLLVLPLPMAVAAVAHQALAGGFRASLTLCAVLGVAAYIESARAMEATRPVSRMRPGLGWAHPLAGLLRAWVDFRSLLGVLTRRRMDWRGRVFDHPPRAQGRAD